MKSRYHAQYLSSNLKYKPGSNCGCKSFYVKDYRTLGSIVVQVERCKGTGANKRPHKRCPWEWVHVIKGEIKKVQQEGNMAAFEQFLKETVMQGDAI